MKKPIDLIVAVALLAPAALLAQTPPGSPASKAISPATPAVDPAVVEILRKSTAAQVARKTYRALMSASIGGVVMPSLEVEVIQPDRVRIKRSGLEIVSVGGRSMMRQGDKWSPAPDGLANFIGSFGDSGQDEKMLLQAVYAKSLGPTKLDDRVVQGFELHSKGKNGLTRSKIFLSPDDGLVRRVETKGELKGRETSFTAMVGDYGVPLVIELPK